MTNKQSSGRVAKEEINNFIKAHREMSRAELSAACGITREAVRKREEAMDLTGKYSPETQVPASSFTEYKEKAHKTSETHKYKKHLDEAVLRTEELEDFQEELFKIKKTIQTIEIKESKEGESEAVAFMVASDWHIEERVDNEQVNGMNEFNPQIAEQRAINFFKNGLRLIKIFQRDTKITKVVIPLLGDFFSNTIHEELAESNYLMPGDAAWEAQRFIVSGLQFMLENSDLEIICVCHTGNHGRMTKKVHVSTEAGNSLERYMYRNIAEYFEKEKRLKFIIAEGQHTYLPVFGMTVRMLHGHSIKYGGGIGGITIPVRKAISQWDKIKKTDLTILGHFHQRLDGGNFIANGSMIGYNAYALAIKADYEPPSQQFFLISNNKGGEKTVVAPIRLE